MSNDIISEILGSPIEQELSRVPNTDSEISPDYTIDFLYNSFLKPQLKERFDKETWFIPKRDMLSIIEQRINLLKSSSELDSEDLQTIANTHKEIYLSVLSRLEDLFEFSSEEATGCAPENWQLESLIQNVTALYQLFIIHREDTIVLFLVEYIKQNLEKIIGEIKNTLSPSRIKTLIKFLSPVMKEVNNENIAILYYNLTEICEKILSTEIDAESFFEILEYADEGELNITLASELIPKRNTTFFSNLVYGHASEKSCIINISTRVRGVLADYLLTKFNQEEEKE